MMLNEMIRIRFLDYLYIYDSEILFKNCFFKKKATIQNKMNISIKFL